MRPKGIQFSCHFLINRNLISDYRGDGYFWHCISGPMKVSHSQLNFPNFCRELKKEKMTYVSSTKKITNQINQNMDKRREVISEEGQLV
jgi:hypothetical protein